MKRETIAIHVGYDGDPTTKAVAVPIYQTIAFEFDSAEHGAALFNLDVQGNIYTRIGNPTNTVLEKRVAALEGGVDALSVSSGMAAIHYALVNIAEMGRSSTGPRIRCSRTFCLSRALRAVLQRAIILTTSRN
jgi:O-acetylhomoserine (thiol)-lyase